MARLGDIQFTLLNENRDYSNAVTSHPVEGGSEITDNSRPQSTKINISGIVTGPNAGAVEHQFRTLRRTGELIAYVGRAALNRCVIERYNPTGTADVKNGFQFSLTIAEVRVALPSATGLQPSSLRADTSEINNVGLVRAT